MAEQTEQVQAKRPSVEEILAYAQKNPGTPGAEVVIDGEGTGHFYNTADEGNTTTNVPRRRGSKFLPGHDAKMYKLNRRFLAGEVNINEHQRQYMEQRGMSLDPKAFQAEQKRIQQEKDAKKQQATQNREAAKAQKEQEKAEAKAARESAKGE